MKSNLNLKQYYLKYRMVIIPSVLLFLAFFIVFRIILPQFSTISDSKQLISDKNSEVETLQKTLSVLSSQNDEEMSGYMDTASKALPSSKDIAIIFQALTSAAAAANSDLKEFSLKVGRVYGKVPNEATGKLAAPAVDVTAKILSKSSGDLVSFPKALQERLPLSEVSKIDINSDAGTYEVNFFYKAYDLAKMAKQTQVNPLSQADLNFLNQLKSWDK